MTRINAKKNHSCIFVSFDDIYKKGHRMKPMDAEKIIRGHPCHSMMKCVPSPVRRPLNSVSLRLHAKKTRHFLAKKKLFHTHPPSTYRTPKGLPVEPGPSPADINAVATDARKLPGIVFDYTKPVETGHKPNAALEAEVIRYACRTEPRHLVRDSDFDAEVILDIKTKAVLGVIGGNGVPIIPWDK